MKELAGENKTIIAPPFEHYLFTIHVQLEFKIA